MNGKLNFATIIYTNEILHFHIRTQPYVYRAVAVYIRIIYSCLVSNGYLSLNFVLALGSSKQTISITQRLRSQQQKQDIAKIISRRSKSCPQRNLGASLPLEHNSGVVSYIIKKES